MSHDDDIPMSVVFALIIALIIILVYVNHLCEPEKKRTKVR